MASKTQMFNLLRLLGQGAYQPEVIESARQCWSDLPEETRREMISRGGADGRRARVWAAGWTAGYDAAPTITVTQWVDDLATAIRDAVGEINTWYESLPDDVREMVRVSVAVTESVQ